MYNIIYIIPAVILVVWILLRTLLRVGFNSLSTKIHENLGWKISAEKIRLTKITNLQIEKEGIACINIDKISISSKLFNKKCLKIFGILIGTVSVEVCSSNGVSKSQTTKTKSTEKSKAKKLSFLVKFFLQQIYVTVSNLIVSKKFKEFILVWSTEIKFQAIGYNQLEMQIKLENSKLTAIHQDQPVAFATHSFDVKIMFEKYLSIDSMTCEVDFKNFHIDVTEALMSSLKNMKKLDDENDSADVTSLGPDDLSTNTSENKPLSELVTKFPKIIKILLSNITVRYKTKNNRALQLDWNCVLSWQRIENKQVEVSLDLLGLVVNGTNHCKLLLCKQVTTYIKLGFVEEKLPVNCSMKFDSIHIDYIVEEIDFWHFYFTKLLTNSELVKRKRRKLSTEKSIPTQLMERLLFQIDVLFENVSCDIYFTLEKCFSLSLYSFSSRQINVTITDLSLMQRKFRSVATILDTYFYVNMEDIIDDDMKDNIPCIFEHDHPHCVPSSHKHSWGRFFEIGSINLKCNCDDGETVMCNVEVDFISFEWSYIMGTSLLKLLTQFYKKKKVKEKEIVDEQNSSKSSEETQFFILAVDIDVSLKDINIIVLGNRKGGFNSIICKFDDGHLFLKKSPTNMKSIDVSLNGIVVAQLLELQKLKTGDALLCQEADKYETKILSIDTVTVDTNPTGNTRIDVGKIFVLWTANKHMALYEQINDGVNFSNKLKTTQSSLRGRSTSTEDTGKSKAMSNIEINVTKFSLDAETEKDFSFSMKMNKLNAVICQQTQVVQVDSLSLLFNEKEIFQLEIIRLEKLSENNLASTRSQFKSLAITNSAWDLSIQMIYGFFPHAFDFADSLQKVQLVFKMLKKLHKKTKPPNYVEPLPPDISLTVSDLLIEFEDDPFEVKLIDNYILLMDEMEQAYEREHKLEMKLNQIKSEKATMVSGKKVDDLRRNLKEKNAQIYIERSKEMYVDREPRKSLFTILLKNICCSILADYTMHGRENVIQLMSRIDPDSELPDNIGFTTLWARTVSGKVEAMKMVIRDFPQPLVFIEDFSMKGVLLGAEATGDNMSSSEHSIHVGYPWNELKVTKNMPPLKYFYDLKLDMAVCQVAWGANFEPAYAMVSLAFDRLSKASIDKSPPLPFFDKIRLLLHGDLKADIADLNIILNASNDPYNTTEKLEIEWNAVTMEWTNGNIMIDGDFDLYTRTASKYDDSRVMHLPSLKIIVELEWLCDGDANGHHTAYPTNPKYLHLKEGGDSYYYFRSLNVNMNVNIDSSMEKSEEQLQEDPPSVFLYASTFRWFQIYQAVNVTRVSRPIKRGPLFGEVKPKKIAIGRHYKLVNIDFKFPCLNLTYWGSFQQEVGFEAQISNGHLSIAYQVFISPHPDVKNLIRRPVANWIIRGLTCKLENTNLFLLESIKASTDDFSDADISDDDLLCINEEGELRKHYLFSVLQLAYGKQNVEDMFTHKLLLHGFKGAWTAINRKLVFELLEAYAKMQNLKKVLSAVALKITTETTTHTDVKKEKSSSDTSLLDNSFTKSPLSRMQSSHAALLLQQLVSEQSSKFIAQVEEGDSTLELDSSMDKSEESDIIQKNWHIEFINSQVLLHGTETKGAIILTSETATILKCLHRPVLDSTMKLNKVSWCGHFLNLQYFSTVQNFKDINVNNIPWLSTSIIVGERKTTDVKSTGDELYVDYLTQVSDAVGVFIDVPVGDEIYQLQRVVARCALDFHFVNFDDEIDPIAEEYPPIPVQEKENSLSDKSSTCATTLRIKHGKFAVSTSHAQYAVILDICQNLIFYSSPKQKEKRERREKMRFKLQLSTEQDLRGKVSLLQKSVRSTQELSKFYERKLFDYMREAEIVTSVERSVELKEIMMDLEEQIEVTKDQLFEDVEELKIIISAYKDVQQLANIELSQRKHGSQTVKKIDVLFNEVEWQLTREDGLLGIAKALISRFRYTQSMYKDNSGEHCFEVGHFELKNLLPNEPYKDALIPHEINIRRHLDKSVMLRVFCRLSPAVAGIMIKEHFEVNVCPIAVQFTLRFYRDIEKFFFPKSSTQENPVDYLENTELQLGIRAAADSDISKENASKEGTKQKVPPPRPPPPRPPPPTFSSNANIPQPTPLRSSMRRKGSGPSQENSDSSSTISKGKRSSRSSVGESQVSPPGSLSVSRNKSTASSFLYEDRNVNTMKERASKNQQFIYVKIPEVPVFFSYKGEKERNIEDASNFNLRLPTLEYHSRMWTWQDLFQALKKDYIQVLVPQILKEKLHLKSSGADTKPSIAQSDDTNKARLLLGEKQYSGSKKSAKKLFGKLLKSSSRSTSHEKLHETVLPTASLQGASSSPSTTSVHDGSSVSQHDSSGKGVDPSRLENQFKRLREMGGD